MYFVVLISDDKKKKKSLALKKHPDINPGYPTCLVRQIRRVRSHNSVWAQIESTNRKHKLNETNFPMNEFTTESDDANNKNINYMSICGNCA